MTAVLSARSPYKCTFTEGLRFDRASFTRLSLDSSQFHRFQARDATFLSTLDLRNVRSPDARRRRSVSTLRRSSRHSPLEPGECSIDLANAHIHGDLWLNEASLKVGSPYGSEKEIGPYIYALILRGAEIRARHASSPGLRPTAAFQLRMRISRRSAYAWSHPYAQYGAALRAQNARIDGIVFCRARTDITKPGETTAFQATGCRDGALTFQNAKLGRLDLRGAHVTAGKLIDGNADKDWCPAALGTGWHCDRSFKLDRVGRDHCRTVKVQQAGLHFDWLGICTPPRFRAT
ncbi:MAG: hypothetical protein HZY74_02520 [Brevundimonas sp.]|nr:MAG: hypothetical protein HZY74_02520 [Brevundimonas sp.]